ncbi:glycerate kinase [Protopterus annectens]|uniref:glycerate kinase n=1 Tax=Protopterus annectens TaxID=7888 RepID=UPI001CFC1022|nr:glycerate kinase [Protopterus annectens]XP_043934852.1 glycerate kinase [Protopterus annectens]XP_043934853.1 glycerate kinase [Protopterus annectens]XP_043934854.1 glycerate kinase [Protopterus annectens]
MAYLSQRLLPTASSYITKNRILWNSVPHLLFQDRQRDMSSQKHGLEIFRTAVNAVSPENMIKNNMSLMGDTLTVCEKRFHIHKNVYLVGFGKAVLGMAAAAEDILGPHLVSGVISVPYGIQEALQLAGKWEMLTAPHSKIQVIEGAKHNLPDEDSLRAANHIRLLAERLTADNLLVVLISGGGSALLPAPVPPITLEEKQKVTKLLASKGATIQELNTVRKTLSLLKGGGLAKLAYPAQVVSLVLSDVIGDSLDIIASGPTVASNHTVQDCLEILSKYNLTASMPESVNCVVSSQSQEPRSAADLSHVSNSVIGSNTIALNKGKQKAEDLGYNTMILSTSLCGEVSMVSKLYSLIILYACSSLNCHSCPTNISKKPKLKQEIQAIAAELTIPDLLIQEKWEVFDYLNSRKPVCLLTGGEPTVQLQGKGKGGRNQELALRVAVHLHRLSTDRELDLEHSILFLSAGTDGQDGPTEAAGAVSSLEMVCKAEAEGLLVESFLTNNDSYTFFSKFSNGQNLITTGLTGTNVMDIQAVLITPKVKKAQN